MRDGVSAGALRHRVVLQKPDPASPKSAKGQRQTEYIDVATVSADIEPLTSRESFLAAQQQASTSHMITIRYSSNVRALDGSWRVLYRERQLTGSSDPAATVERERIFVLDGLPRIVGERRRSMVLPCVESDRKK